MLNKLNVTIRLFFLLTFIIGFAYPFLIMLIAQVSFPWRSEGSLISLNGRYIGSELIGQNFTDPKYFFGRPSATQPFPYNPMNSGKSGLVYSGKPFINSVFNRISYLEKLDKKKKQTVPIDLVTYSASGLDPEISLSAALYQVGRIADIRNIPENVIRSLVVNSVKERTFGILGEPRINVLLLNMELDNIPRYAKNS